MQVLIYIRHIVRDEASRSLYRNGGLPMCEHSPKMSAIWTRYPRCKKCGIKLSVMRTDGYYLRNFVGCIVGYTAGFIYTGRFPVVSWPINGNFSMGSWRNIAGFVALIILMFPCSMWRVRFDKYEVLNEDTLWRNRVRRTFGKLRARFSKPENGSHGGANRTEAP